MAQVYVSHRGSSVPRPLVELKGFERVRLKAGESRRVTIVVPLKRLEYWDESADRFVLE